MNKTAVYAINAALVACLFVLLGLGKLTWPEALVGVTLLLAPSAAVTLKQPESP